MVQFNRRVTGTIQGRGNAISLDNLRISFRISKTLSSEANDASIEIYNLSLESRNQIEKLDDEIIINAGYEREQGPQLIFRGDITNINHDKQLPDVISSLKAGDGIVALREARRSFSFKEGTSGSNVLNEIAGGFGLTIRDLPSFEDKEFTQGFSYSGSLKNALGKVTEKLGLEWSIQNKEILILRPDATTGEVVNINRDEGLLRDPQKKAEQENALTGNKGKPGYEVTTLLRPDIEPGMLANLQSDEVTGSFKVNSIDHTGDVRGSRFLSVIKLVEL